MVILGLTGSIGMGKSTAARMFRAMGVPVYDADAAIHKALAKGGAGVEPVEQAFPGVVKDGAVDRQELGKRVFNDPPALRRLESILHPIALEARKDFLRRAARRRVRLVVLDIPLLFETGGEDHVDAVVVVTAPRFLQTQRVLSRPGMTPEKLAGIRARQTPEWIKRKRADFVVPTGQGKGVTLRRLERIAKIARHWRGTQWPPPPRPKRSHARNRPRHRDHRARSQ